MVSTRGMQGACYPPVADTPTRMTFSFYAKGTEPDATISLHATTLAPGVVRRLNLTTEWQRYQISLDVPPPAPEALLGGRFYMMVPGPGSTVWISGLQLEKGEEATAFRDDSQPVVEKKVVADDPDNLLRNAGAEYGTAEHWHGLENPARLEFGVRPGAGRTGDYAFYWRGQSYSIRSAWVPVDPTRRYELNGYFRAESGAFDRVTFGLLLADERRREIKHFNVFSVPESLTELTKPCRAGDRILHVKHAAGWMTGSGFVAAFGAGENELTFTVTPPGIREVRPVAEGWIIGLDNPCGLDLPARR